MKINLDAIMPSPDDREPNVPMKMAYGGTQSSPVATNSAFRTERGHPFMRGGKLVYATPQFKGLTIYSPVSTNGQLPAVSTTPTAIAYPSKVK